MTESRSRSRAPLVFAILGLLAALAAGGAYAYREVWGRDERTPEQTVDEFLMAVFGRDVEHMAAVVCGGWDPEDAVRRTASSVPLGASVSWEDLRVLRAGEGRAVVRATLALRPFFDGDISDRIPWTFNLVDERGWRVCEARRLT